MDLVKYGSKVWVDSIATNKMFPGLSRILGKGKVVPVLN
jgi:hypothetical protein